MNGSGRHSIRNMIVKIVMVEWPGRRRPVPVYERGDKLYYAATLWTHRIEGGQWEIRKPGPTQHGLIDFSWPKAETIQDAATDPNGSNAVTEEDIQAWIKRGREERARSLLETRRALGLT